MKQKIVSKDKTIIVHTKKELLEMIDKIPKGTKILFDEFRDYWHEDKKKDDGNYDG